MWVEGFLGIGITSVLALFAFGAPLSGVELDARSELVAVEGTRAADVETWLRAQATAHPDTRWRVRLLDAPDGGAVAIARETWAGRPIASAVVALRFDAQGEVRSLVGRRLDPQLPLPRSDEAPQLWWPTQDGLVAAEVRDEDPHWEEGRPAQRRRYVAVADERVLASESLLDESGVHLRGWDENGVVSEDTVDVWVPLESQDPLTLRDDIYDVVQCGLDFDTGKCEPFSSPVFPVEADSLGPFPATLPDLEDPVHGNPWDDLAAVQAMQFAKRLSNRFEAWEWDSFAWDTLDCTWADVPVEECRLTIHVNLLRKDEMGVFFYGGAFYSRSGRIYMGQGENADTSFDRDIVIHEIGHHMTWSYGAPEATGEGDDGARRYADWSGLNEGNSDVFATMMNGTPRMYDYYSEMGPGLYVGPRTRDVSLPFRCPENVYGEVHMEGRIWVSTVTEIQTRLDEELGISQDDFVAAFLRATAVWRQIPREQGAIFADASAVVVEELDASLGADAASVAQELFDERGLSSCDYALELRGDPAFDTSVAPEDREILDARFLVLSRHDEEAELETIEQHPYAPALQYTIELEEGEGGIAVEYRANLWRPSRPVDDPGFRGMALVKRGEPVSFSRDHYDDPVVNDADAQFFSTELGEDRFRIEVSGLEPGERYYLALAAAEGIEGELFVMEDLVFETLPVSDEGEDTDTEGSDDEGEESGETGSAASGEAQGCGCRSVPRGPAWAWPLVLVLLTAWRRRRTSRAT